MLKKIEIAAVFCGCDFGQPLETTKYTIQPLRRSKMTDRILLKRGLLLFVLVTMVSISGALTQANGDDSKKEIKLKDAVVLKAKNRVRANPGFRLVLEGKDTVVVFKKNVRIGPLKCSVCPGGQ